MESQSTVIPLPFFFIGKDLTSERISNYLDKHNLLTQELGRPDTKSVWYSREHISALLDEIDHASGDGLRVYLGAYESEHPDYPGQTCLLMAVTRETELGETTYHGNVVLEDEPDFAERSALPRGDAPQLFTKRNSSGRKKDFNHGSPCPPVCDNEDGFDFP